ncbi:MAG: hypothetical protein E7440_02795 [Ruminococcaceae bacterium]|nr:hypothetical protein [Oscillospiraceae bacterium]
MEENMEHLGLSRNKKIVLSVAAGLTALIVLTYLGLCIYVGGSRTVLPGVRALQVELGGMTREDAVPALDAWVEQAYADAEYDLRCADTTARLSGGIAYLDSAAVAQDAYMVGRAEPFLKRGAVILSHLLGGETAVDCLLELNDAGKEQMERALEELERAENVPLVETVWAVNGNELTVTRGVTGVSVDRDGAMAALLEAMQQPGDHEIAIPVTLTEPVALDLKQVHAQIYAQAADAYVQRDEQGECQVVPHVVGVDFDSVQAQERFDAMNEGDTLCFPLTVTVPDMTRSKLESMLFANVLGECSTNIGGTEYRLNNVIVAAKAMNGKILMPGEVFSYNETLGPRTTANGYLPAPAYIGGKTVDDVGGGICQNSSTLYMAVLRANLEIVTRTNHMYTVGYVPDGLDATVAYNAIDFKFRNSTPHPIRVEARVSGRTMIVKLHGTDTENVTVKMETKTLSTTPYQVTYKPDSAVAVGTTVVDTTAYTGRKVQVFRCVYDAQGKLISRTEESMNNYRHRDKVILYNPADAVRLGLVDENGQVHSTVQPKPEPKPEPVPGETEPEQDAPTIAPEPEVPEQDVPAMPEVTPARPDEGGTAENDELPTVNEETEGN